MYKLIYFAALVLSAPLATTKPPAFFLAGDSTTATQAANGGGWGDGFLNTTLKSGATGKNYGHNGRTTKSFRDGGDWATVLASVKSAVATANPFVTIQFGHNDQKESNGVTLAEFQANLVQFTKDVTAAGGTPVLVTALNRMSYGSDGKVKQDLADMVAATKAAATQSGSALIDLNAASVAYDNSIGATNAAKYALKADDHTHLNVAGSIVFGNMVAILLDKANLGLNAYVVPRSDVKAAIAAGKYIAP